MFIKLKLEIFQKNAKNRMRVPHACKLHSTSMAECITKYGHLISDRIPMNQLLSVRNHIRRTDQWIDIMNSRLHHAEPINDVNHRHIYELLDYASYFEQWKRAVHEDNFVPSTTYEDVIHTCTGVVLTARYYLPKWEKAGYPDEDVQQRRATTDDVELLNSQSRGGNAAADAMATNSFMSGNISNALNSIAGSKKRNCGQANTVSTTELASSKIPRRNLHDSK